MAQDNNQPVVHPLDVVKYSYNDITLISSLSYILGKECEWGGMDKEVEFNWFRGRQHIQLIVDFDNKEFKMVNWQECDTKYYALIGLASMKGFTLGDYYMES